MERDAQSGRAVGYLMKPWSGRSASAKWVAEKVVKVANEPHTGGCREQMDSRQIGSCCAI